MNASPPRGTGNAQPAMWEMSYVVTSEMVNYHTCTEMNYKFELSVDKFVSLNSGLQEDCMNVEPETKYYVKGYQ
jgi:hypothetical protein